MPSHPTVAHGATLICTCQNFTWQFITTTVRQCMHNDIWLAAELFISAIHSPSFKSQNQRCGGLIAHRCCRPSHRQGWLTLMNAVQTVRGAWGGATLDHAAVLTAINNSVSMLHRIVCYIGGWVNERTKEWSGSLKWGQGRWSVSRHFQKSDTVIETCLSYLISVTT